MMAGHVRGAAAGFVEQVAMAPTFELVITPVAGGFDLDWSAVDGALFYRVWCGVSQQALRLLADDLGTTSYSIAGLNVGIYFVQVTAVLSPRGSLASVTDDGFGHFAASQRLPIVPAPHPAPITLALPLGINGEQNGGAAVTATLDGTVTVLHAFGTESPFPLSNTSCALLLANDGNYYGACDAGGDNGGGAVYQLTPGGTLTVLHSFLALPESPFPNSALIQGSDGALYGTVGSLTSTGEVGGVYRLALDGSFTELHNFANHGGDGAYPSSDRLVEISGTLYGTTEGEDAVGGSTYGTVYSIGIDGSNFQVLHTFTGGADSRRPTGLLLVNGVFYGTTFGGTGGDWGSVYSINLDGTSFMTLYTVPTDFSAGRNPLGALTLGNDGRLYGATNNQIGSGIFAITTNGDFTQIHAFGDGEGYEALGPFYKASDGSFYGVCQSGTPGESDANGTLWHCTADGSAFSIIHIFNASTEGDFPAPPILAAS